MEKDLNSRYIIENNIWALHSIEFILFSRQVLGLLPWVNPNKGPFK